MSGLRNYNGRGRGTQTDTADVNKSSDQNTVKSVRKSCGKDVDYYSRSYFHSATCCKGAETRASLNVGGTI